MRNLRKKLKTGQGPTDVPNQSSIGVDTVDELQTSSSLDDNRSGTATVDEYHHHHHESLDVERCENSASSKSQLNNSNENDLNEYCLLEIFSYLSMDDMIQVKRVCKMWYQVSQQWFKQVQTLVYDGYVIGNCKSELYEKYYKRKVYEKTASCSTFNELISILHSYGHHIKYYEAKFPQEKDPTEEHEKFKFQCIPKLCKNIVEIRICGWLTDTASTFIAMATHWKKLVKINVRSLPLSYGEIFFELLRNNQQLKSLELWFEYNPKYLMSDKFFTYLPKTIKKISITNMPINDTEQLSHFISASKNFTSLESLEFENFHCLTDAVVAAIVDIKSLTHLSLCLIDRYESRRTIDSIANLKGLKSLLLLGNDDQYEDSFINIVESCTQLEQLNIRHEPWLTDKGMDAIVKLKRLKCLDIPANNVTTRSIINLCDSLEVLRCYDWNVNNRDVIEFLKKATNLRFLDFGYCYKLTKKTLKAANEIANKRKNNVLCITAFNSIMGDEDIDTAYFKYVINTGLPLEIFPNDIIDFIKYYPHN